MTVLTSVHPTIDVLQAGRALAALSVVASHTILVTEDFVAPIPEPVKAVLEQGYLGVDFFFVLSGFIIYYVNNEVHTRHGWTWRYAESRLTRIYVPYLPVGVALALFYTLFPDMSQSGQPWTWWATLTLIPNGAESALGVAWTLTYELHFYLLALIFFKLGRPLTCASVWAAAIVIRQIFGEPFAAPIDLSALSVLLNPINLEFVFGMYAAWLAKRMRSGYGGIPLAIFAVCIGVFIVEGLPRERSYIVGLGLACLVVVLVRSEWAGTIRVARPMVLLGDASYAIYLLHLPLMSVLARVNGHIDALAYWPVSIVLGLSASAVIGLAFYRLYERPALRLARRYLTAAMVGARQG